MFIMCMFLYLQDPVDVEPYTEEYDATDDGLNCPQWMVGAGEVMGDEDCLNLNVYTPKVDKKKRAVMVYIHGGAFITGGGSSTTFGPTFLLENDVVVVTMNYRLGALGFMATADKAISGNMGIKDQAMALKWVQNNIANFGGDPSKVTIFGDDAGGASVSIHMMSEESNGKLIFRYKLLFVLNYCHMHRLCNCKLKLILKHVTTYFRFVRKCYCQWRKRPL